MDVREVGWWAKKSDEVLIERKLERLQEMRLAQHGDHEFDSYCEDLQMKLLLARQSPSDEFVVDSRPQFRDFVSQLKGALSPLTKTQIESLEKRRAEEKKKPGG